MKRLLVNADDLGLSTGITAGVIDAHVRGIVTSASIAATGIAFEQAVESLRQHPRLRIGVHLTLAEEACLTRATPFAASYTGIVSGVLAGAIPLDDVECEWRAQIERCLRAGLRLTHLDSHQHVHALPSLMRIAVGLACEYSIPRVRVPLDTPWRSGAAGGRRFFGKSALCGLGALSANIVQDAGLEVCDQMRGIFESGSLTEDRLLRLLDNLPTGTTELLCHPAHPDAACRTRYAHWSFQWDQELAALTSPAVRQRFVDRNIELI